MNTVTRFVPGTRFAVQTVEDYLAFLETRPDEERWQLIDGEAIMMPPPTLRHQDITTNIIFELKGHFRTSKLPYKALHEVGLIVPTVKLFRPECDVAVVDATADFDTSWADRFFLATEILSDSNTKSEIAIKLQSYQQQPANQYSLIVSQTEMRVEVYARAAEWHRVELTGPDAVLELPLFGLSLTLADIYRDVPLPKV
jgi:Uma2 family endonuclease